MRLDWRAAAGDIRNRMQLRNPVAGAIAGLAIGAMEWLAPSGPTIKPTAETVLVATTAPPKMGAPSVPSGDLLTYGIDVWQRSVLLWEVLRRRANMFSPGICWSGLRVNRSGSFVQALQMYS
jgi:hypothetical protein